MKVLHIGKYYPPFHGGMESYLKDLAEAQVRQGHQVVVLVHNHAWGRIYSRTEINQVNGVDVIRQACTRPLFHTPLMPGLNRRVRHLIKQRHFDVIHLHTPNPSLLMLSFNRQARQVPWVISWHSDMVTEQSSWLMKALYRLIKPLENRLIRQSETLVVSSEAYTGHSDQLSLNRQRVKVMPLGIDCESMPVPTADNSQQWWPDESLKLFHLGRLTPYKNQVLLIDAMQHLQQAHLVLAGTGQLFGSLKQRIAQCAVQDRVNLPGGVSETQAGELFHQCEVFCLPSHDRAESFGVVLLEAMYHDKIILVADTPGSGMSWLASQYNKGFVFRSNDVNDLVAQLNHIHRHLAEIQALPRDFKHDINDRAGDMTLLYQSIIQSMGEQHET